MTTNGKTTDKNVALVYVRVSRLDAKDADRKLSPRTQVEQCKALPALRGLDVEVFEDLDLSGATTARPGYQKMLGGQRRRHPDHLPRLRHRQVLVQVARAVAQHARDRAAAEAQRRSGCAASGQPKARRDLHGRLHQGHPPQPALRRSCPAPGRHRRRWHVPRHHRRHDVRRVRAGARLAAVAARARSGRWQDRLVISPEWPAALWAMRLDDERQDLQGRPQPPGGPQVVHLLPPPCLRRLRRTDGPAGRRGGRPAGRPPHQALPPGFARAVDSAVAARTRTFGKVQTTSAGALAARQERLNDLYLAGSITKAVFDRDWREIQQHRPTLASAPPAPLFTQQQSVLTTLVDEWCGMTADERKRMLAAIFDSVTAGSEGVDRLEPCADWRPYMVAALPKPVNVLRLPTERKTGFDAPVPPSFHITGTPAGDIVLRRAA